MGRCSGCGEWNTLVETIVQSAKDGQAAHRAASHLVSSNQPQSLSAVPVEKLNRIKLAMEEFNRVLGGGSVPGSLILLGGAPGVGKRTLLLQI